MLLAGGGLGADARPGGKATRPEGSYWSVLLLLAEFSDALADIVQLLL